MRLTAQLGLLVLLLVLFPLIPSPPFNSFHFPINLERVKMQIIGSFPSEDNCCNLDGA